jgi:hypothetical protein
MSDIYSKFPRVGYNEATRVTKPVRRRVPIPRRPDNRAHTTVQSKPVLVIPTISHVSAAVYIHQFERLNHLVPTVTAELS